MLKRIITSIFALCVLVPILLLSHTWVFPIAISVVSVMCLFEMFRCMGYHKKFALTLPAYAISALLPVFQRIFENGAKVIALSAVCAVAYLVYAFALVICHTEGLLIMIWHLLFSRVSI